MLKIQAGGADVTFDAIDGWRSNDALVERHLRATCKATSNDAAIMAVTKEYGPERVTVLANEDEDE